MHSASPPDPTSPIPYLEHFPERGGMAHRTTIERLPFQIGRSADADLIIYSSQVSKEQAEIYLRADEWRIRDLGSTNGTFVNGQRITETALTSGDIIHFAHKEFRFCLESANHLPGQPVEAATDVLKSNVPSSIIAGSEYLKDLLCKRSIRVLFQPIVNLTTRQIMGCEALGRGTHGQLTANPAELLRLADQCQLASQLSRLFRTVAALEAVHLPEQLLLFFNVHPSELKDGLLVESLRTLHNFCPDSRRIILEVHEEALVDSATMRELRQKLDGLGVGLAYDDFGAGQARLMELVEQPPAYLKLDRKLIRNIQEHPTRQELVQALNRVAVNVGVQVVAEGIETEDEAGVCLDLGCQFGQGFLFGRPQSALQLTGLIQAQPA